jgi:hypothetical protein
MRHQPRPLLGGDLVQRQQVDQRRVALRQLGPERDRGPDRDARGAAFTSSSSCCPSIRDTVQTVPSRMVCSSIEANTVTAMSRSWASVLPVASAAFR